MHQIIDDFSSETDNCKDLLIIKLTVDKDIEPQWHVTNKRVNQEDIEIKASDRAKFNTFIVSDYIYKQALFMGKWFLIIFLIEPVG